MSIVNVYKMIKADKVRYDQFGLQVPFRLCLLAPSGTGKNNILTNLLHEWIEEELFEKVIFVTKMEDQPIYKWIKEELDPEVFSFEETTPDPKTLEKGTLLVLDDQIMETKKGSNKQKNDESFVFGRHAGVSICFLTQIYGGKDGLSAPVRKNLSCVIFKDPSKNDQLVLKRDLNIEDEEIKESKDNWVLVNKLLSNSNPDRVKILE